MTSGVPKKFKAFKIEACFNYLDFLCHKSRSILLLVVKILSNSDTLKLLTGSVASLYLRDTPHESRFGIGRSIDLIGRIMGKMQWYSLKMNKLWTCRPTKLETKLLLLKSIVVPKLFQGSDIKATRCLRADSLDLYRLHGVRLEYVPEWGPQNECY